MNNVRQQVTESVALLTEAITGLGVDLEPLGSGFLVTENGTVLVQLRPLLPAELIRLAVAIRVAAERL
ncbi:hypothetical protein [Kitasatospora sp. GAS204B]|uniref:hypothetical protein n=1 Tax=unclassified Kitasatospora TaxID=2633591 RepID=UPI0024769FF3|nr:hypothetical protein [Kitasatospora sp. GAS204B]MDH6118420.1 hypothetical protein [Kitasatospora sp. GAS204B]